MGAHFQTTARTGWAERQKLGVVGFVWGKKGGIQLQTEDIIGSAAYKSCLFSLSFMKYIISIV